ncbi:MAG: hypothetical protein H0V24_04105 [Chloroflexia bacterium]|nr:hypothetical protein [Chloroflexia bacterium]
MSTTETRLAMNDLMRHALSRRSAAKLLGGTALVAAMTRLGLGDAAAACQKAGANCDKKKRCCNGTACKREKCACKNGERACNGVCRDLETDRNNCGKCGVRCRDGVARVKGICTDAVGSFGAESGQLHNPHGVARGRCRRRCLRGGQRQ